MLALLHWSQRGLADLLKCDERLVRRWASGDAPIPVEIEGWLDRLAKVMGETPVPQDWRKR